jgi:tetratricopeptide (TPR) repeat protein
LARSLLQIRGETMSETEILNGIIDVPQSEAALLLESGYLLMEMNRFKEAEEVFAGVAALLPASDVPLTCLGNLYFAQGKYQRALKAHQDALKLRPDSANAKVHVGESLLFLGKQEEGLAVLQEIANSDQDPSATEFAQALLEAHRAGELK